MAYKQQKFAISIPKNLDATKRQLLAREVIDFIVERTQNGMDKNNESFKKAYNTKSGNYSKGYKNSLDYSIAGKSDKIDLTLSGDMLADLSMVDDRPGKMVIGYHRGYSDMGKVEGNVLGTYGQSSPVSPPRDFLGITQQDLERIVSKYKEFPLEESVIQGYAEDVLNLFDFEEIE